MAKKLLFILLVVFLFAAGAVVSMADEDPAAIKGVVAEITGTSIAAVSNKTDNTIYIDAFSSDVIERYGDLFFNRNSVKGNVYFIDSQIKIEKDKESADPQDYMLCATLVEDVKLVKGDCLVVMAFIKTDDGYSLLRTPKYMYSDLLGWYEFRLPNTGKENPNRIRLIVYLKSAHEDLELGKNLQITDHEVVIELGNKGFKKSSLMNTFETIKQVESKLN